MSNLENSISVVDMAQGALKEQIDAELSRVLKNMADPNTEHGKPREINVKLKFTTNADRNLVSVTASATSKLQPNKQIQSQLFVGMDGSNIEAVEITKGVPGQINVDGEVIEQPKAVRLAQSAQ